jgi:transcriptional regulator NrdR family protein
MRQECPVCNGQETIIQDANISENTIKSWKYCMRCSLYFDLGIDNDETIKIRHLQKKRAEKQMEFEFKSFADAMRLVMNTRRGVEF